MAIFAVDIITETRVGQHNKNVIYIQLNIKKKNDKKSIIQTPNTYILV